MSYGPLIVQYVDIQRGRVFIRVDPKKSTSPIEELTSEDAKTLAIKAATRAGMQAPALTSEPQTMLYDAKANKPAKLNFEDTVDGDNLIQVSVVELVSTLDSGTFLGDSKDYEDLEEI